MLGDEKFVSNLFRFEENLRNTTSKLQGYRKGKIDVKLYELAKEGYYDSKIFKKAKNVLNKVKKSLCNNFRNFDNFRIHGFEKEGKILCEWLDYLESEINVKCSEGYPFTYCYKFNAQPYKKFISELREKGLNCGFIEKDENEVSFVKVLDSFTNCLHTLAIKMSENVNIAKDLEDETGGICRVISFGDKRDKAVTLCKIFADNVMKNNDSYYSTDKNNQEGVIIGNKVEFKIGCGVGHASRINLDDNSFEYYDFYEARLDAVKEALERLGLSCEKGINHIVCKEVDFEKAKKIARLLAFLPSLDIYMKNAVYSYVNKHIEPCIDECIDRYKDKLKKECEKEGLSHILDACMRDKCWRICESSLSKEGSEKIKKISVEALEKVIKDENITYKEVITENLAL